MPGKPRNLIGQKFGRLSVVALEGSSPSGRALWRCVCSCGESKIISTNRLTSDTASCGCLRREHASALRASDITGQVFGKLTAIQLASTPGGRPAWLCACACGGEKIVLRHNLASGITVSCGCLSRAEYGIFTSEYRRAASAAHRATRRSRQRGAPGTYTAADIESLYLKQRGCCANCGCALGDKFHRDHRVSLFRGGSNEITNIELLCGPCNQRKHAKDPIAWARENGRLI